MMNVAPVILLSFSAAVLTSGLASAAPAALSFVGNDLVKACPQLQALPPEKYSGVKWVMGSTTGRMFVDFQFLADSSLMAKDTNELLDLTKRLDQLGTKLIIVPIPRVAMYYESILDKNDPRIKGYDFEKSKAIYMATITDLESKGLNVVNLNQDVLDLMGKDEEFFFDRDIHWTPTGAQKSAQRVASYITSRFPDAYGALAKDEVKLSRGPTGQMFGYGGYAKGLCGIDVPPMTYQGFTSEIVNSEAGLLGDERNDVVILGDSYGLMHGYPDWGFGSVLSYELKAPVVNGSIPAGGPTAAITKFFGSLKDVKDLPKFLIWEFAYTAPPKQMFNELTPVLQECKPLWKTTVSPSSTFPLTIAVPALARPTFVKMENYITHENLSATFTDSDGKTTSYTFNRHNTAYNLDGANTYSYALGAGAAALKSVQLTARPDDMATLTLCGS